MEGFKKLCNLTKAKRTKNTMKLFQQIKELQSVKSISGVCVAEQEYMEYFFPYTQALLDHQEPK